MLIFVSILKFFQFHSVTFYVCEDSCFNLSKTKKVGDPAYVLSTPPTSIKNFYGTSLADDDDSPSHKMPWKRSPNLMRLSSPKSFVIFILDAGFHDG